MVTGKRQRVVTGDVCHMHKYQLAEFVGLKRLELCDGKLSRTVLRGGSLSNETLLPDRHANESIKIGINGEITVVVLNIKENQVKIGIDAAKDIPVHRAEIYERIIQEKNMKITQQKEQT
jgi:carbon storage regulator